MRPLRYAPGPAQQLQPLLSWLKLPVLFALALTQLLRAPGSALLPAAVAAGPSGWQALREHWVQNSRGIGQLEARQAATSAPVGTVRATGHYRTYNNKPEDGEAAVHDRLEAAVLAALVADALCLGSHYEYDSGKIRMAYGGTRDGGDGDARLTLDGRNEGFQYKGPWEVMGGKTNTPGWGEMDFHPTKTGGMQTDYGDNLLMAVEHLAAHRQQFVEFRAPIEADSKPAPFAPLAFGQAWKKWMEGYAGYKTMAAKEAFKNLKEGLPPDFAASEVSDLGGAARAPALLLVHRRQGDEAALLEAAAGACRVTHRDPASVAAAQFIAGVAHRVAVRRQALLLAMKEVAALVGDSTVTQLLNAARGKLTEANDPNTHLGRFYAAAEVAQDAGRTDAVTVADERAVVSLGQTWKPALQPWTVGKASPTVGALTAVMYLALRYDGSLADALISNALLGGDSASRAVALGAILGAQGGKAALPSRWLSQLASQQIVEAAARDLLPRGD
jgi:ADP-ribosylglycohydrolase